MIVIFVQQTRLLRFQMFHSTTGFASSKYVVYATACAYRELYGKITDRKKNCLNNYLI